MVGGIRSAEVVESVLAALVNICIDHEENCRRILMTGVEVLSQVAKSQVSFTPETEDRADADNNASDAEAPPNINPKLANDLLHLLEPFNWIQCTNCKFKNDAGERCVQCGHKIIFSIL